MVEFNPTNPVRGSENSGYIASSSGSKRASKTGSIAEAMQRLADRQNARKTNTPTSRANATESEYITKINEMSDDTARIIAYNRQNYPGDYYGIFNSQDFLSIIP